MTIDLRRTKLPRSVLIYGSAALSSETKNPIAWWVDSQVAKGNWREITLPPQITGLDFPVNIFETERRSSFIKPWRMSPEDHLATFCPPTWYDVAIGSGACGLQCRSCFLMLTHRIRRDPRRHLIYTNFNVMKRDIQAWLLGSKRRSTETLGLGIDCSDSLLYDRYTNISQWVIPMFSETSTNPKGCRLILLTKSANVDQLKDLPHNGKIVVSFSLNPQSIADLWEGITPPISKRLEAGLKVQSWGYHYRWRIDPILTPHDWEDAYAEFFAQAHKDGHRPEYITVGTYREKNNQLLAWAERWGLPPMGWQPNSLEKDGSHWHLSDSVRSNIYSTIHRQVRALWGNSVAFSLCKESHSIRRSLKLCNANCNCLK